MFWHPLLVHLPIALALVAPVAGAIAIYLTQKKSNLARAAWIGIILWQIILVGSIYTALATGENDEELLGEANQENYNIIHEHEERAEIFFIFSIGVVIIATAAIKENKARSVLRSITLLAQISLLFICLWTGHAGGKIVHEHGLSRYLLESNSIQKNH